MIGFSNQYHNRCSNCILLSNFWWEWKMKIYFLVIIYLFWWKILFQNFHNITKDRPWCAWHTNTHFVLLIAIGVRYGKRGEMARNKVSNIDCCAFSFTCCCIHFRLKIRFDFEVVSNDALGFTFVAKNRSTAFCFIVFITSLGTLPDETNYPTCIFYTNAFFM